MGVDVWSPGVSPDFSGLHSYSSRTGERNTALTFVEPRVFPSFDMVLVCTIICIPSSKILHNNIVCLLYSYHASTREESSGQTTKAAQAGQLQAFYGARSLAQRDLREVRDNEDCPR